MQNSNLEGKCRNEHVVHVVCLDVMKKVMRMHNTALVSVHQHGKYILE